MITAVRVALKTPVIVTGVSTRPGDVVMLKVAKPRPAGTVTVAGTCAAAGLLLESVTATPPAGAALFRKRVALIGLPPVAPLTLGLISSSASGAFGSAPRFSHAVLLDSARGAGHRGRRECPTGLVVIAKLAVLFPAAMVTLGGTWAGTGRCSRA